MSGSRATRNDGAVNGLLLVDKPAGCTSHDVVAVVRRAARTKRVGHAGTLDPFATGLLVIAVGTATRLLPYLAGEPKVYDTLIRFGTETTTDDATGDSVREAPLPDMHDLFAAIATLTGTVAQVPPAYSAKHVDGVRAYVHARRGVAVDLPASDVTVHSWNVTDVQPNHIVTRITCAGGTYIRSLARDLGRALNSAAHCAVLRRVASGMALVENAVPYTALAPGAIAEGAVPLHSPRLFLAPMAHVELDADGLVALAHGRAIPAVHGGTRAALVHNGDVVAIAERLDGDRWQPRVVLTGSAGG